MEIIRIEISFIGLSLFLFFDFWEKKIYFEGTNLKELRL